MISDKDVFIIDDWRLLEDSLVFIESSDFNVITVYLTKEDKTTNNLSFTSNLYEHRIRSRDCDINFQFKKNWSNSQELLNILVKRVIT